jgi:hypothetical protein
MTELTGLVARFGAPVVLTAAAIYILLRSDIRFIYPRKRRDDRQS